MPREVKFQHLRDHPAVIAALSEVSSASNEKHDLSIILNRMFRQYKEHPDAESWCRVQEVQVRFQAAHERLQQAHKARKLAYAAARESSDCGESQHD